jgi:hypothetical protein
MIPLLRNMGFLDQSNTPTPAYSLLKAKDKQKLAIAQGIRSAYAPLFAADEGASELSGDNLKSLIAQIAGTDDDMTARIANTFAALVKQGDFKAKLSSSVRTIWSRCWARICHRSPRSSTAHKIGRATLLD